MALQGSVAFLGIDTDTWKTIAEVLTAVFALWQLTGLRDERRAKELESMERTISSAAARDDGLAAAYRSYTFSRMRRTHGTRLSTGVTVVAWSAVAVLFMALLFATKGAPGQTQLVPVIGFLAAVVLAARSLKSWIDASQTLHNETYQALTQAMVDSRKTLQEHPVAKEPLREPADIMAKSWAGTKAQLKRNKGGILLLAAFVGLVAGMAWIFVEVTSRRMVSFAVLLTYTSWFTAVCLSLLPLWSATLKAQLGRLPRFFRTAAARWSISVAWVVVCLRYGPSAIASANAWLVSTNSQPMTYSDLAIQLAAFAAAGLFVAGLCIGIRGRRWLRRAAKGRASAEP